MNNEDSEQQVATLRKALAASVTRDLAKQLVDGTDQVQDHDQKVETAQTLLKGLLESGISADDAIKGLTASSAQKGEALKQSLQAVAAEEADAHREAIDLTQIPPLSLEASTPSMLSGRSRKQIAWAILVLAFASVLGAPAVLVLSKDSDAAGITLALVFVAMLSVIAAWFVTMGYGTVKIRTGSAGDDTSASD